MQVSGLCSFKGLWLTLAKRWFCRLVCVLARCGRIGRNVSLSVLLGGLRSIELTTLTSLFGWLGVARHFLIFKSE